MKKLILALGITAMLAACETPQQTAAAGALAGAAAGAALAGNNETEGALIGAAVGTVAGALIGNARQPGMCRYRYPDGSEYVAACPN